MIIIITHIKTIILFTITYLKKNNMRITLIALTLFLVAVINADPCNRCFWEGAYCGGSSGGSCATGLTCQTLKHGSAPVCLPTVAPGEACNDKAYDPCPSQYYCDNDLKVCILNPGLARINDGCDSDDDCQGILSCRNGMCVNEEPDTFCDTFSVGCPIGQYCYTDVPVDSDPVCVEQRTGGDCTSTSECFSGSCINGKCVNYFSGVVDAVCSQTMDCKVGLICETRDDDIQPKCYEPLYMYITPTGFSRWGIECDSENDGCTCNQVSQYEQFLIEGLSNLKEGCKTSHATFMNCMKSHSCYSQGTFEHSCMRQNCWGEHIDRSNQCYYEGLSPVRCGASEMMLALIMVVAFLFLH
eukprot:TRINITY_DN180_c1_g1_i2.p1 TRINITY_DN180_c1_g1~~TRINITY_DN180_c1_g1_i2.p1  ORF type:complete len:356 (+),score=50.53 TRINITY_DN180_c1_g1_i2:227-1294(+)